MTPKRVTRLLQEALYERYAVLGARWLHIVDLDGARGGTQARRSSSSNCRNSGACSCRSAAGCVTLATVTRLLSAGVDRVVVGSVAITQPTVVSRWFGEYGGHALMLALDVRLDARGVPHVATHGWSQQSTVVLWDAVDSYIPSGLKHVLCTDISRDGTLTGPNCELYVEATQRFPCIAWQASGGIRDASDLRSLAGTGASAAISGRPCSNIAYLSRSYDHSCPPPDPLPRRS